MYIVFDIGGTKMRVAASEDGQKLEEPKILPTPQNFEEGINLLKETIKSISDGKIAAITGGIAGRLDEQKTQLLGAPHLPSWVNKPIKENLQKTFSTPIFLENDAALAGLGEALRGAGKGYEQVLYLTISTGVGGVRIINGKIDQSRGFNPGHQVIVKDGNPCDCGDKGHLEAYISGSGLEKIYGKKAEEITDLRIWDEVAQWLTIGLNKFITGWTPDIIVLGGAVTQSIPLEKVQVKNIPIVKAGLGDLSGLHGALEYLKQVTPQEAS